jgi:hypothetical protein
MKSGQLLLWGFHRSPCEPSKRRKGRKNNYYYVNAERVNSAA